MRQARLMVNDRQVSLVDIADTRSDRRRGLLKKDCVDTPMWFPKTQSVHTIGMRITIDVVYVDRSHSVISVHTMPRGRVGLPRWKAAATLELGAGAAHHFGIVPGAKVTVG